ncbi:hypothetical protein DFJ74DRAFT_673999 [Hyaloraphidium curvatum]|nr:hypothetical protein DFJ74DRAFT_673999 [Hyaloraphidium curvatum]
MGAIVVRPPAETSPGHAPPDILVMANNVPVYPPANNKKGQSAVEIHAEANAVALCAQRGIGTQGAWIYISFPPCKDCFMSVLYAGIKRVVFRNRMMHEDVKATAKAWGVELVEFDRERDMACNQLSREIANKWKEERNVATGGQQEGAGAEAAEEADADAAGQEANGEAP